jgi:hypothetical protein
MMNLKEFGSVHVLIVVLSQQLPEGTGQNHKKSVMLPVVFPKVQTGAVSCSVTDSYSDGASEIFSKFCLFPGTWTTVFFRMSFSTRKA